MRVDGGVNVEVFGLWVGCGLVVVMVKNIIMVGSFVVLIIRYGAICGVEMCCAVEGSG